MSSFQHIYVPDPDITIYTDSSTLGWGVTDGYNPSGGRWKADEINHINVLELKAIFIGVLTYCKGKNYKHVTVMSDNITVSYVNNKGVIKSEFCNEIAKELWVCCTSQNIWISVAHIPGTQNTEADIFSRSFNEAIEWKLSTHLFQKILSMFGNPTLDLFASRINHQIDRYISWKPDLKAPTIDAFSIKWNTAFYYIFPPFSLLRKVTAKICRDKTKVIVVIRKWPTQYCTPAS